MVEVRIATVDDIHTIQVIAEETWPVTFRGILSSEQIVYMLAMMYSTASLEYQMRVLGHVFLLALDEEGEAMAYVSCEVHYGGVGATKIHKLYALPSVQGRGIGRLLVEKVAAIALQNTNKRLLLNVNRYNAAVAFYEKMGFCIIGEETIDIGSGYLMEDFVMEKELGGNV